MIDRQLITRKMSLILQDLAAMTRLSQLSRERYLEDSINEALSVAVRRIPLYLDHVRRFIEKMPPVS
jgi:hypothetical protein